MRTLDCMYSMMESEPVQIQDNNTQVIKQGNTINIDSVNRSPISGVSVHARRERIVEMSM